MYKTLHLPSDVFVMSVNKHSFIDYILYVEHLLGDSRLGNKNKLQPLVLSGAWNLVCRAHKREHQRVRNSQWSRLNKQGHIVARTPLHPRDPWSLLGQLPKKNMLLYCLGWPGMQMAGESRGAVCRGRCVQRNANSALAESLAAAKYS